MKLGGKQKIQRQDSPAEWEDRALPYPLFIQMPASDRSGVGPEYQPALAHQNSARRVLVLYH